MFCKICSSTLGNLGEVTRGEFWALKFLCIFHPSGASASGFALSWDFSAALCWPGNLCPKGLDFFAGRVPSEKNPFIGLGKHWHHFQFLCSFLNTTPWVRNTPQVGSDFSKVFKKRNFCIDKVHWDVLLKLKIDHSRLQIEDTVF